VSSVAIGEFDGIVTAKIWREGGGGRVQGVEKGQL